MAQTTTAVVTTIPPPDAATIPTAARLAPPLRGVPRGGGVTSTGVGAVPRA